MSRNKQIHDIATKIIRDFHLNGEKMSATALLPILIKMGKEVDSTPHEIEGSPVRGINCVGCENGSVYSHGETDVKRPNGEMMHLYECQSCGQLWKE